MRNGDFIAVGTVDFTDEEMSLIKNIFDSICFYPYKSDNTYKGEKVISTLSYMLPYVPFFLVYHDYQCICSGLHIFLSKNVDKDNNISYSFKMKLSGVMRFKGKSKIEDLDIFSWYDYNTELSELMDIFKDVISECKEFQKRYEVKHIKF